MAAAVVFFYAPLFSAERLPPHGDISNLFLPGQIYAARAMGEGIWPLWNPYQFMGSPFHAGMQSALFYPPYWLLRGLIPEYDQAVLALNLSLLFHLLWLATGTFVLLRAGFGLSAPAAAFGGFVFAANSYTWNHLTHVNQIATLSWTPWIVWLARAYAIRGGAIRMLSLGAAMGLAVLSGHPQNLANTLIFCAILLPAWSWESNSWRAVHWRLMGYFAAGALALGLAGVQLAPTAELSRHAWIMAEGRDYASSIELPPGKLIEYIHPFAFGSFATGRKSGTEGWMHEEMGLFFGLTTLLFGLTGVAGGLLGRTRARRIEILFLTLAIIFGLLMAVGKATPFFDMMLDLVPPLRRFRAPARYMLLVHIALIRLAATGLDWTILSLAKSSRGQGSSTIFRGRVALYAAAAVVMIATWIDLHRASAGSAFRHAAPFYHVATESPVWQVLERAGSVALEGTPPAAPERLFWMIRQDHFHRQASDAHLVRAQQLTPDNNLVYRLEMTHGYGESLQPTLRYRDFLLTWHRSFFSPYPDVTILRTMNVGWIISDVQAPIGFRSSEQPSEDAEPEDVYAVQQRPGLENLYLYRVPRPLPRVFEEEALPYDGMVSLFDGLWRYNGTPIDGMNRQLQPWRTFPGIERRDEAKVENALRETYRKLRMPASSINEQEFALSRNGRRLIVSQGAYPGWVLRDENGRVVGPVTTRSAILQELPRNLPPGFYRLSFEPGSFRLGVTVSALAILLFSAIATLVFAESRGTRKGSEA